MAPEAPTVGTTESGLVYQWTDPRDQAARQVEQGEPERAHAVLDVVAEDPQRPHVADDVEPAAVEEHAGQERPVVVDRESDPRGPSRVGVAGRHDAQEVEEPVARLLGQGQLEGEGEDVQRDQRVDGQRRIAAGDGVLDRYHRSPPIVSFPWKPPGIALPDSADEPGAPQGWVSRACAQSKRRSRGHAPALPVHAVEGGFDQEDLDVAQWLMRDRIGRDDVADEPVQPRGGGRVTRRSGRPAGGRSPASNRPAGRASRRRLRSGIGGVTPGRSMDSVSPPRYRAVSASHPIRREAASSRLGRLPRLGLILALGGLGLDLPRASWRRCRS